MEKKRMGVLEGLGKLTRKDLKINLSEEEQIYIINQMAADKMSKARNFVLGGTIPEPTREEILEIEKIKIERDIDIQKVKLQFNKKKIKELKKKKK